MSSSINSSSNPERPRATGGHFRTVAALRREASGRDPATASQDAKIQAVGAGAIRVPGGSASTSDRRVLASAKVLGGAASADSTIRSTPSPYLEDAPVGAQYFKDELGLPMKHASFREPEFPYEVLSPFRSSLSGLNSVCPSPFSDLALAEFSPSPDLSRSGASAGASSLPFSIKYDENNNYHALGTRKSIEDLALGGMIGPEAAYAYLGSIISTPGDFVMQQYLQVNQLLLGMRDVKFRAVEGPSFCIVPKKYTKESVINEAGSRVKMSIERLLKIETGCIAINAKAVIDRSGSEFCIYQIIHDTKELPRKLGQYLEEFNEQIAIAFDGPIENRQSLHLRAIIFLFQRLEQLRPVDQSRRTNLAVLNYLLSKHNFPGVIFKNQYAEGPDRISLVDYMSYEHLGRQIIQGMKDWCKEAGRPYPF